MTELPPDQRQPEMPPTRWGDPAHAAPLPDAVRDLVGLVFPLAERPAEDGVAVPPSRLPVAVVDELRGLLGSEHVRLDDTLRRQRTRGRSTPDLLRQRAGDLGDAPDLVVRPGSHEEVAAVLGLAERHRVAVVPFGGGTSVTGGLVARRAGLAGVLSLDLARMRRLLAVDPVSATATLEPGLRGPEAEALLAGHGLMLGHQPQSFEFASIGGFAATRSSGQSSAGRGRFDAMVVGLRVATPRGEVRLGTAPADAAGPDLRQLFLGSEGAFGVITEVTVRVRPLPEVRRYEGWRWPSFAAGADAMRLLAQADLLPTVLRLSDEAETAVNLARPDAIGGGQDTAEGVVEGGCLMVVGHEGTAAAVDRQEAAVAEVLRGAGGTPLGPGPGEAWVQGRYAAPYLRDSLLDVGVLVETLETATFWSGRERLRAAVTEALVDALGEGTMVLCHVSHVYATGCSLYFTVVAAGGDDPLERWRRAKAAANDAIVACGASITHHHAVGTDHRDWLPAGIGPLGVDVLRAVKATLDPAGILNPGVLVP
ncbi:FAD-binding oxidoreductase [Nocardioides sp. TF02-7]|uniref:FAD-binding oxidoreductase n=1 Tax=Nocardioides sp. TF02-7 TaxID=2917724 RepID=UPI001F056386|nr:FAD-binding oxidoreductase [Nocardioides sp. TF02-7]UMG94313.1 FAD-binding oxidoreductase [Nocardioides sp. TF02-7]